MADFFAFCRFKSQWLILCTKASGRRSFSFSGFSSFFGGFFYAKGFLIEAQACTSFCLLFRVLCCLVIE